MFRPVSNLSPLLSLSLALLAQCIEKRPICSSLAGFQFTKWDAESHDEVRLLALCQVGYSSRVGYSNCILCSPPKRSPRYRGQWDVALAGPLISCNFFPEHFLLPQSVSALLDKFKKSDQVFDINAKMDSNVEDYVATLPDDDFSSDSPRSTVADKIGEFTENLNSFGTVHKSKR